MPSILRRINTLAGYRSFTNFFFYALGELAIIVAGIFLALQLDEWKNMRAQHQNEIQILKEINSGFTKDIHDISFNISLHEAAIRSAGIVLDHFERNLPYTDSLARHFAGALWYSRFVANDGPFEALKLKGLEVISNDTLRVKIIEMYDNQYEGLRAFEQNTFLPDSYTSAVNATRFDKTELYIAVGTHEPMSGRMVPYNYEQLKKDRDYIHVLKSGMSKNRFLIDYFMKPSLRSLDLLKTEVNEEIKRLEGEG